MKFTSKSKKGRQRADRAKLNIISMIICSFNVSLMVLFYMPEGTDQLLLAEVSERSVEEKSGVVTSIYSSGAKIIPPAMAARIAVILGPRKVAHLSERLPVERAVDITQKLEPDFLMEVTKYLNPEKASRIIEKCPDELLIDVTRRLLKKEEYQVLAGLSDHLSPEKLRTLAGKLTATEDIQVAGHMKNMKLIGKVIVTFPDDYLIELMKVSVNLNNYQLAGEVIQEMDIKRLVDILGILSRIDFEVDAFLKEIIPHVNPLKCAEIVEASADQVLVTLIQGFISRNEYPLLASIADNMSSSKLKTLAERLSHADNIKVAGFMQNRQLISRVIAKFSDDYLLALMKESAIQKSYRLAAEVIQEMDKKRVVSLLEKLSKTDFPLNAFLNHAITYMMPEKFSDIIEMSSDQTLVTLIHDFSLKNEYKLMASMADHLSPGKLKTLATRLSIADNIKVADLMQNRQLIARVIAEFSDNYLIDLMKESAVQKYYRLAAEVIQEIDKERLRRLLEKADQINFPMESFLNEVTAFMDLDKISEILESSP